MRKRNVIIVLIVTLMAAVLLAVRFEDFMIFWLSIVTVFFLAIAATIIIIARIVSPSRNRFWVFLIIGNIEAFRACTIPLEYGKAAFDSDSQYFIIVVYAIALFVIFELVTMKIVKSINS